MSFNGSERQQINIQTKTKYIFNRTTFNVIHYHSKCVRVCVCVWTFHCTDNTVCEMKCSLLYHFVANIHVGKLNVNKNDTIYQFNILSSAAVSYMYSRETLSSVTCVYFCVRNTREISKLFWKNGIWFDSHAKCIKIWAIFLRANGVCVCMLTVLIWCRYFVYPSIVLT